MLGDVPSLEGAGSVDAVVCIVRMKLISKTPRPVSGEHAPLHPACEEYI